MFTYGGGSLRGGLGGMVLLCGGLCAAGCGNAPCPSGTTAIGDRCVPSDGGPEGGQDAGSADAGVADGSADGATDGSVDACTAPMTLYRDADGDGHGDPSMTMTRCAAVDGWVTMGDDCDDGDATVFPGSTEVCDGVDQDCDGAIDEGLIGPVGAPTLIGTSGVSVTSNAVAPFDAGYVVTWVSTSGLPYYQTVTPAGALIGPPQVVAMPAMTGYSSTMIGVTTVGNTAVFAWVEHGQLRGRRLPLDATTPSDPVDLSAEPLEQIWLAPLGNDVLVAWRAFPPAGPGRLIKACVVDGATGTATAETTLLTLATFDAPAAVGVVQDDPLYALVGFTDQRAGDLVPTAYVERVDVTPNLHVSGDPLRLPFASDPAVDVEPVGVPATPMALVGVTVGASTSGAFHVGAVADDGSGGLTVQGDFSDFPFATSVADAGGSGVVSWLLQASAGASVSMLESGAAPATAGVAQPLATLPTDASGYAITRTGGTGAIVYTTARDSMGHTAVYLQRLGCE